MPLPPSLSVCTSGTQQLPYISSCLATHKNQKLQDNGEKRSEIICLSTNKKTILIIISHVFFHLKKKINEKNGRA